MTESLRPLIINQIYLVQGKIHIFHPALYIYIYIENGFADP